MKITVGGRTGGADPERVEYMWLWESVEHLPLTLQLTPAKGKSGYSLTLGRREKRARNLMREKDIKKHLESIRWKT